jgi:tRNA A37 N6-isopentenylltransferase MiaA
MAVDMEIRSRLAIDKHSLDRCLMEQPALFLDASDEYTRARSQADELKEVLKQTDAEIASEIRESGDKHTEKSIEACVLQDKRHKQAFAAWLAAQREADEWDTLKQTIHQRGYVLKDMVALFVAGYYQSATTTGANAGVVRDAMNEGRRAKIAAARKAQSGSGTRERAKL